jgi:hypothetical protein
MTVIHLIRKLLALLILALTLAGCKPYLFAGQLDVADSIQVREGEAFGQTFVAAYDGLEGVQLFLEPGEVGQGNLLFRLRSSPESAESLATVRLPLDHVEQAGYYSFDFPVQTNSQYRSYYASLDIEGEGELGIQVGPPESYRDGAAYLTNRPVQAQARFHLSYQWISLVWGLLTDLFSWTRISILGFLLFVLPGWALISLVYENNGKLSWPEKLSLGAGLSLAVYPLLMLWIKPTGIQPGAAFAWLPAGLGLVWLIWRSLRRFRFAKSIQRASNHFFPYSKPNSENFWPTLALVIVSVLLLLTRFWAIRSLEAPMWGDSVQHAVITQLLLDNGGLFSSWEPYTPYNSLTVQYGFPAAAAVFAWFSGASSWHATLYTGQLINVLAVFTLYPLALRLTGNQWAGVASVLIAGLISTTPAIYVNWGRYAQLAGLAMLPAALWLLWASLETPKDLDKRNKIYQALPVLIMAGIVLAGMSLSYYRMPFFYATFALALLVGWGLPNWRANLQLWGWGALKLAFIGGAAGLLFLPWVLQVMQGSVLAGLVQSGVETSSTSQNVLSDYQVWQQIGEYIPPALIGFTLVSLVFALMRRKYIVAALGLWMLSLASLVALSLLRVPGANLLQNFAIIISLYIPISLVTGWAVGELAHLHPLRAKSGQAFITVVFAAIAIWFAIGQRNLAQPDTYALVTRPDMQAMSWIRDNTPTESLFLVEGFRIYGYSAVGSDAGWWLPLLAERQNTIPPQYALMNEAPVDPDYSQNVVQLVGQLEDAGVSSPQSMEMICKWGITHVYIGQRQGKASYDAPQLFSPEEFLDNPDFSQVYQKDHVHIFALKLSACENRDG